MSSYRRRLARAFCICVVVRAIAACSDSLHLDPDPEGPGGAGAASGPGAGGAGGEGPIACTSSSDCPAPTAVCDQAKQLCVECLEFLDCAFRPGTVCSQGACVCASEEQTWCPAISADTGARPARCTDLATTGQDCGTCGHGCFGACAAGACVDPWEPTPIAGAPSARARHVCAWTGTSLVVWGGDGGGSYPAAGGVLNLAAGTWKPTSVANAPAPRAYVAGAWTGERFFVWGGHDGNPVGSGGLYDPSTDTWKTVSTSGAPSARHGHTVVWAADAGVLIVWGGVDGTGQLDSGARYDPARDAWTATSGTNAPSRRRDHSAVWSGARMLVYGGVGFDGVDEGVYLAGGKLYDPVADTWDDLPTEAQPSARARHASAAGGGRVVVWGGEQPEAVSYSGTGATYDGAWTAIGGPAPSPRRFHTAVWIGDPVARMVFFGGDGPLGRLGDGGILDAEGNFSSKAMPTGPAARNYHCAVAAGTDMIVWGGETNAGVSNTGGALDVPAAL